MLKYYDMMEGIKTVLSSELMGDFPNLHIQIEGETSLDPVQPLIQIYAINRRAAAPNQRLAAGRRTDFEITFSILCYGFSLESGAHACQLRDELIGAVEIALMKERTFNGTVDTSWLEGGEFTGADRNGGFFRAGEVRCTAIAHAAY